MIQNNVLDIELLWTLFVVQWVRWWTELKQEESWRLRLLQRFACSTVNYSILCLSRLCAGGGICSDVPVSRDNIDISFASHELIFMWSERNVLWNEKLQLNGFRWYLWEVIITTNRRTGYTLGEIVLGTRENSYQNRNTTENSNQRQTVAAA